MNISKRLITKNLLNRKHLCNITSVFYSLKSIPRKETSTSALNQNTQSLSDSRKPLVPNEYRFIYPEFLPDPKIEWRNNVKEKLERMDMLDRRTHIDIPEFYVGSILAVTSSDPHATGKTSRFVGICIDRDRCGLRARFILRNVIDHQGIEIQYEMYDPTIHKIEVLRLEKRLDDKLFYLRDALPEYSTFNINMEPEILPEGSSIPINEIQIKLKPRPWLERWERQNLKGISNIYDYLKEKHILSAERIAKPWEKYDLMKEYRSTIPDEEQKEIYTEVYSQLHQLELARKKMKRKRTFVKPTKLA